MSTTSNIYQRAHSFFTGHDEIDIHFATLEDSLLWVNDSEKLASIATQLSDLIDEVKEHLKLEEALRNVRDATNVPELCKALGILRDVDRYALNDLELPTFMDPDHWPEVDWSDWNCEPLAADDDYVLFREQDGSFSYWSWENVLDGGEDD